MFDCYQRQFRVHIVGTCWVITIAVTVIFTLFNFNFPVARSKWKRELSRSALMANKSGRNRKSEGNRINPSDNSNGDDDDECDDVVVLCDESCNYGNDEGVKVNLRGFRAN